MNKEKNYGVWGKYFASGVDWGDYLLFKSHAQRSADLFISGVEAGYIKVKDDLTPTSQNPQLDEWVAQNDAMLTELVRDIQNHILSVTQYALPAHDERQIIFKDASEGLRFYQMEKPQGYKSTFQIAMFSHDAGGRLFEGFYYDSKNNPPENWIPHAQMSFIMLKDILDQTQYREMPRLLKDHLLYAVLAHSGDNGQSYMSRAVQTCDRMQLIGAEGFYRALSYVTCLMNSDIKYPEDSRYQFNLPNMFDHKSVLSILEYCSRNMRENIGNNHEAWQRRIAVENVVLLKAACEGNDDLAHRMFAPELEIDCAFGPKKRKIDAGILREANEIYAQLKGQFDERWSPFEVASAAIQAIELPIGAAKLSDEMKTSIHRAVGEMSDIERKSLFQMMRMADLLRAEQDGIDRDVCLIAESDPRGYVRAIAEAARKYAEEAPVVAQRAEPVSSYSMSIPFKPFAIS